MKTNTMKAYNGNEVVVHIPMELRNVAVDKQHPERVASVYGPVVMVGPKRA
jgi:DUF1680 family protein